MYVKLFSAILTVAVLLITGASVTSAAPWIPADNQVTPNDRFVAYYDWGTDHTIPGIGNHYIGRDLVMQRDSTGQFHQWFEGENPDGVYVAIHSVWNLSKDGTCPVDWITIPNAYPGWGDYMTPGATYCVHNNYYQGTR